MKEKSIAKLLILLIYVDSEPIRNVTTIDLLCWAFQVARGMEYLASRNVSRQCHSNDANITNLAKHINTNNLIGRLNSYLLLSPSIAIQLT